MPAIKDNLVQLTAKALAGGAGPTFSPLVDLRTAYGGVWQITVTNGPNRLGKAVEVQVEIAFDTVAGNEFPFDCRQVAKQPANAKAKFAVRVPPEARRTRIAITHGDDAATIDAVFTRLTQV